jgi:hypothetical protein
MIIEDLISYIFNIVAEGFNDINKIKKEENKASLYPDNEDEFVIFEI